MGTCRSHFSVDIFLAGQTTNPWWNCTINQSQHNNCHLSNNGSSDKSVLPKSGFLHHDALIEIIENTQNRSTTGKKNKKQVILIPKRFFCFRTKVGEAVYVAMATISLHDRAVHVISLFRKKRKRSGAASSTTLREVRPCVYDKRSQQFASCRLLTARILDAREIMELRTGLNGTTVVTNLSLTKSWLIKSPSWL